MAVVGKASGTPIKIARTGTAERSPQTGVAAAVHNGLRGMSAAQGKGAVSGHANAADLPQSPAMLQALGFEAAQRRMSPESKSTPAAPPSAATPTAAPMVAPSSIAPESSSEADLVKANQAEVSSVEELMSYGAVDWAITDKEARAAFLLLTNMPDADRDAVVRHLDASGTISRLLDNLPDDMVTSEALTVLKVLQARTVQGHQDLREKAIRALELQGKDPDALLGTYRQTKGFSKTYTEEIAEQGADGTWKANTYVGTKGYSIGITDREIVVSVVIRLTPDSGVTNIEQLKARWLDGIKGKWNRYDVSNGTVTRPLRFRPLFQDAGFTGTRDHDVNVVQGPTRSNQGKWDTEDGGATTAAHEFGHMLGNKDEYGIPVRDAGGQVTGSRDENDSIMSRNETVQPRHLDEIVADLNSMRDQAKPAFKLKER